MTQTQESFSVLVTGVNSSLNLGDFAMVKSLIHGLGAELRSDSCVFTVLSPHPSVDKLRYQQQNVPAKVVRSSRKRPLDLMLRIGEFLLWRVTRRFQKGKSRFLSEEARAIAKSDLIVDLSGDMLTESHGKALLFSHLSPLILSILSGKPFVILAQSIGPFSVLTIPLVRAVFRRASLVTLRDSQSYQIGQGLMRGNEPLLAQVTDSVFSFYSHILSQEPQGSVAFQKKICVTLSSFIVNQVISRLRVNRQEAIQVLAETFSKLADDTGYSISFLAHVQGPKPHQDDRIIAREVILEMSPSSNVDIISPASPEDAVRDIASFDLLVGARMHSLVAAISAGVPVIGLAYSYKTVALMNDIGLQDSVIDCREENWLGELVPRAQHVLSQPAQVARHLDGIVEASKQNFHLLGDTLNNRGK